MHVTVLQFPGSNCDQDVVHAFGQVLGCQTALCWHAEAELPAATDLVVLPGGFSYGDYLRCGAIAAHAPVLAATKRFAERGGVVLGVCNGFQILTEARLLPGALLRNRDQQFVCRDVTLRIESQRSALTARTPLGTCLTMPVAHMDGNYFADDATLDALEAAGQVVLRYVEGPRWTVASPNGAARAIAGICNAQGNVIGLMPHPERAVEGLLGSEDGRTLLAGLVAEVIARRTEQ